MLGAAGIALAGVIISAVITTKIANKNSRVAQQAADAATESAGHAKTNADSSERSSKAAVEAVGVNRETASAVAARARADSLAKRYQDSATQLGHPEAHVRLAGAYAMASLADDWPDQRQACVDVLCAYLRLPERRGSTGEPDAADQEVRNTIVSLIRGHLHPEANTSWSALEFNFERATLRGFIMSFACFANRVSFNGATFDGTCSFARAVFDARLAFDGVTLEPGTQIGLDMVQLSDNTRLTEIDIPAGSAIEGRMMKFKTNNDDDPSALFIAIDCYGRFRFEFARNSGPGLIDIGDTVVHDKGSFTLDIGHHIKKDKTTNAVTGRGPNIDVVVSGLDAMGGADVSLPEDVESQWPLDHGAAKGATVRFTRSPGASTITAAEQEDPGIE